ncbi:hypothetical protein L198_08119 [Cryptococcus wingfieldii CBS 7118]|uniref:Uncharacterized protein n=1 Tax=Cryptococcus wingfieldii CBS 7118 TaxID=1295528 RepID=A0A1E3HJ30_9TREE|nr:hypothetical protein L198_08119 [Cryptococcus wingfieldii CBS 7118]ODN76343.1 hypothetical protein L198_08119 [Cryptococcus wingfieldii CBS 7118]
MGSDDSLLDNIPPFPPSSDTKRTSSMSLSAIMKGCKDGELAVRHFDSNTISGLHPHLGFSSISVQSTRGKDAGRKASLHNSRQQRLDGGAITTLVPSMYRHVLGGWRGWWKADPHPSDWISVSTDPLYALFMAANRLGQGRQSRVFLSIISSMPGKDEKVLVVDPREEEEKFRSHTVGFDFFSLENIRARNFMRKFSEKLFYKSIPKSYIVETVEITHDSIPWDDIPLGWFQGGATNEPFSSIRWNWLDYLSFNPYDKLVKYGDAQGIIWAERKEIEEMLIRQAREIEEAEDEDLIEEEEETKEALDWLLLGVEEPVHYLYEEDMKEAKIEEGTELEKALHAMSI